MATTNTATTAGGRPRLPSDVPDDSDEWDARFRKMRAMRAEAVRGRVEGATAQAGRAPSPLPPPPTTVPAPVPSADPAATERWRRIALTACGAALFCGGIAVGVGVMAFRSLDAPAAPSVPIPPAASAVPPPVAATAASTPEPPPPPAAVAEPLPGAASRADAPGILPAAHDPPAPPFGPPMPRRLGDDPVFDGVEIVLHVPPSVGSVDRITLAAALREAALTAAEPVTTNVTIGETHLRYYHADDAAAAERIAAELDATARDFTRYRPSPREGMVELWVAGSASPSEATRRTAARPPRVAVRRDDPVGRFLSRIFRD